MMKEMFSTLKRNITLNNLLSLLKVLLVGSLGHFTIFSHFPCLWASNVNFTVPEQLCRPTNIPPFINFDFILASVACQSDKNTSDGAIGHQHNILLHLALNVVKASKSIESPATGNC